MKLSWHTITVRQFQQFYELATDQTLSDTDRSIAIVALLNHRTLKEIEAMSMEDYAWLDRECNEFLSNPIPDGKPAISVKVNGRRYKIQYELTKLSVAQSKAVKEIGNGMESIHKVLTNITYRVNWLGKPIPVDADTHIKDMLNMSIVPVVHACQYYSKLNDQAQLLVPALWEKTGRHTIKDGSFSKLKSGLNSN